MTTRARNPGLVLAALVAFGLLACAVGRQSLWIDELTTAWIAAQPNWNDFRQALEGTGSEMQMPLFSAGMWVWARTSGVGEWALRAPNLAWAALGVAGMAWLLARQGVRPLALLLLASPFLGYYMNEARPYVMTFAAAAWCLAALETLLTGEATAARRSRLIFPAAYAVALGASMLNLFLLPALAAYAAVRLGQCGWPRARRLRGAAWTCVVITLVFVVYYVWTLKMGHGGQKLPFHVSNALFAAYEFLGFDPLGPPRDVLRAGPSLAAAAPYLPSLLCGLIAWFIAGAVILRRVACADRAAPLVAHAAALATGAAFLVAAAVFGRASLWGRHFMFVFPFFIATVVLGLVPPEGGRRGFAVLGLVLLVGLFAGGLWRQRSLAVYGKDPFREGVARAAQAHAQDPQRPVVWAAYRQALWYYGARLDPATWKDAPWIFPGDGLRPAAAAAWVARHPEFYIVTHRLEKSDPFNAWGPILAAATVAPRWSRDGMRLALVRAAAGSKP